MKRVAVCLFGMSYREPGLHWGGATYRIDARLCKPNHDEYIRRYFEKLGYVVDYFISTNDSEKSEWFRKEYNPVSESFDTESTSNASKRPKHRHVHRNRRLLNVIDQCIQSGVSYDLIFIQRFDILFFVSLDRWNIDFDGFNIISELDKTKLIDDNMYLLHSRHLVSFRDVLRTTILCSHHTILPQLKKTFPVNFMYNENNRVDLLTSFKIVRISPECEATT